MSALVLIAQTPTCLSSPVTAVSVRYLRLTTATTVPPNVSLTLYIISYYIISACPLLVCLLVCVSVRGVEQGITQIDMEDFRGMGVEEVIGHIHRVVGDSPSYVSFDIDVLDPAFASGTV